MENNLRLNVGIVIPTMNRADFVIRQLEYYAKLKSPHSVYVGDASNEENSKKLQAAIEKLSKHLTVNYYTHPAEYTITESQIDLYNRVREEYCVFSGDDDYQIPGSLTKCAEFLESNPEYSSVSGHSVSFRLTNNGVYGELQRLADYPRQQIESPTATERLTTFMTRFSVVLFSTHRTKQMIKCWSQSNTIKDKDFSHEFLPCAMSSVLGKSKIIDCLSFVRQIDNKKYIPPDIFDWITGKDWGSSYEIFNETLTKEISTKDGINIDEARKTLKRAFWNYLNISLPVGYNAIYTAYTAQSNNHKKPRGNSLRKLRLRLGQKLPWLKNIYRRTIRPLTDAPRQIHYEVTRPSSPYHKDFQSVFDSFSGKYNKQ